MNVRITDIEGKKPSFVQWDVDRVLYIEGTDSQPCLHFANPMLTRAIVVEAEADGSRWECRVPNIILQTAAPIVISVFVQPDEGKTVLTDWVKVQPKLKPQDYTYEENIGYTNWVQKSAEAQAILDAIEDLRQEIAQAAEAADDAADAAGEARDQAVAAADGIDESIATALQDAKDSGDFDGRDGQDGAPGAKGDPGDDGISPDVSVTEITGGHRVTITDADNTYEFDVMDGETGATGEAGFSPTVAVYPITGGNRIVISDARGAHSFDVMNGRDGATGEAGVSPEVSVTTITGGHRVTITDAQGAHTFDVLDGQKGDPGESIQEVFWAERDVTTEAEITTAVEAGKVVMCRDGVLTYNLTERLSVGEPPVRVRYWVFAAPTETGISMLTVTRSVWALAEAQFGDTIQSVSWDTDSGRQQIVTDGGTYPIGGTALFTFTATDPSVSFTTNATYANVSAALAAGCTPVGLLLLTVSNVLHAFPLTYSGEVSNQHEFFFERGWIGHSFTISSDAGAVWEYAEYLPEAADTIDQMSAAITSLGSGKQDKNLGAANAGKFLVVGSDGNITAVTMTAWQGGSY